MIPCIIPWGDPLGDPLEFALENPLGNTLGDTLGDPVGNTLGDPIGDPQGDPTGGTPRKSPRGSACVRHRHKAARQRGKGLPDAQGFLHVADAWARDETIEMLDGRMLSGFPKPLKVGRAKLLKGLCRGG